jgi:hypothetical protein
VRADAWRRRHHHARHRRGGRCEPLGLEGELSDAEIHAVSLLVLALVDGLMLAWLIDPDATPDGQELLNAVIGAVGPLVEQRTESV